jgi:hypothetical protein
LTNRIALSIEGTYIRNLDHSFSDGGRSGFAHCKSEVVHGHRQGIQHLGINGIILEVNEIHLLSDLLEGGFRAQSCQISPDMAMGLSRNLKKKQYS